MLFLKELRPSLNAFRENKQIVYLCRYSTVYDRIYFTARFIYFYEKTFQTQNRIKKHLKCWETLVIKICEQH